jgi:hypothetical protein
VTEIVPVPPTGGGSRSASKEAVGGGREPLAHRGFEIDGSLSLFLAPGSIQFPRRRLRELPSHMISVDLLKPMLKWAEMTLLAAPMQLSACFVSKEYYGNRLSESVTF